MKNAFLKACLDATRIKVDAPFPVPYQSISDTFDLDNEERYSVDNSYDDVIKTLFGMGELYGRQKQTHVFLSEPGFRADGAIGHSAMSDSAGVLSMKYLSLTGRKGFSLAIKPKAFSRPDIISHPMAFGLHGFHDGADTLHVDKLLLPSFDDYKRHSGVRGVPVTSETLNYAQNYAALCMEQLRSGNLLLMYDNLRASVPEKLFQSLIGEQVGRIGHDALEM